MGSSYERARSGLPQLAQGLFAGEDVLRVVAVLDPQEALEVRAVVRIGPVLQVRVGEVLEHAAGSERMHRSPRPVHPGMGGRLPLGGGAGLDRGRVLELEPLLA